MVEFSCNRNEANDLAPFQGNEGAIVCQPDMPLRKVAELLSNSRHQLFVTLDEELTLVPFTLLHMMRFLRLQLAANLTTKY